jgi:hypothetical protein
MMQHVPAVSRRRAVGLLALAPAALCLPQVLRPARGAPADPEAALRRALAGMRLPFPARLDLVGFVSGPSQGRAGMAAVVRMTWAPGFRQRRFAAAAETPEAALAALLDAVRAGFSAAA